MYCSFQNTTKNFFFYSYTSCLFCDVELKQALEIDTSVLARRGNNNQFTATSTTEPFISNQNFTNNHMARRINSSNTYTSPSNNEFIGQSNRTYSTTNTNSTVRNNSSERFLKNMTNQLNDSENDGSNPIVCNCNQAALLLTVRKEGQNQGRQFYSCSNNKACDFFQWLDSGSNISSTYGGSDGGRSSNFSGGASNNRSFGTTNFNRSGYSSSLNSKRTKSPDDSNTVMCNCGNPAKPYRYLIY